MQIDRPVPVAFYLSASRRLAVVSCPPPIGFPVPENRSNSDRNNDCYPTRLPRLCNRSRGSQVQLSRRNLSSWLMHELVRGARNASSSRCRPLIVLK